MSDWKSRAISVAALEKSNMPQGKLAQMDLPPSVGGDWRSRATPEQVPATSTKPGVDSSALSPAQTALESYGNAFSFGYLPQLQTMAAPVVDRATNVYLQGTGQPTVKPAPFAQMKPGSPEYIKARDENIARQSAQAAENPKAALAGSISGSLASAAAVPFPGAGAGGGLLKTAGRLGAIGAAQAGLSNPGDVEGEVNPLQLAERGSNALKGGAIGLVAGGAGKAAEKGLNAAKSLPENLEKYASAKAIKASGAMLKDFRKLFGRGRADEVGKFALDEGLVKAGDTFEDIAQKSAQMAETQGAKLRDIYSSVQAKIQKAESTPEKMGETLYAIRKGSLGFRPIESKGKILSQIQSELGDAVNAKNAVARVEAYLDDVAEKYGDNIDPIKANQIKGAIDDAINYSKKTQDLPEVQRAFFKLRSIVRDKIESQISALDKAVGGDLGKQLKEANRKYGSAIELKTISQDRIARENANQMFGLTDKIAGVGGAATGALMAAEGGDATDIAKGAALGLLAGGANKLARTYGAPLLATGARQLGRASQSTLSPAAKGLLRVPISAEAAARAAAFQGTR